MKRAATLKWLAYLAFVLIFAGVLICVKFPYESIESRLAELIAEHWGLKLDVADLRPTLPPKLRFGRFSLRTLGYDGLPVFCATEGYLRPRIFPLLGGKLTANIHAEAYGGCLHGEIIMKPLHALRTYSLQISWEKMRLERHPGLLQLVDRNISGELSGVLELGGPLKGLINSSGSGRLRLTDGSCPIEHPYLRVNTLDGLEVSAAVALDKGELEIDDCRFKAKGIKGRLDGKVQLQSRLFESVLDVAGQFQIDPNMLKPGTGFNSGLMSFLDNRSLLPFHLRGTVAAPTLSLF